jgi:hypothetical protein
MMHVTLLTSNRNKELHCPKLLAIWAGKVAARVLNGAAKNATSTYVKMGVVLLYIVGRSQIEPIFES